METNNCKFRGFYLLDKTPSRFQIITKLPFYIIYPNYIIGLSLYFSCWLSLERGLIWAFVAPALLIILVIPIPPRFACMNLYLSRHFIIGLSYFRCCFFLADEYYVFGSRNEEHVSYEGHGK